MLRLFIFDWGDTLVHFSDVPLDRSALIIEALGSAFIDAGLPVDDLFLAAAVESLEPFNTRRHPRLREVTTADSFRIICQLLARDCERLPLVVEGFFSFFRRRMFVRDDVVPALNRIRSSEGIIGVVSDAPYGMTSDIFDKDIHSSGLGPLIDCRVISSEVGVRKPSPIAFERLLLMLRMKPEMAISLGNEEKDLLASTSAGIQAVLFEDGNAGIEWPVTVSTLSEFAEYALSL